MIESLQFQSKRHFWIASSKTPRNDTVYGPSLRATARSAAIHAFSAQFRPEAVEIMKSDLNTTHDELLRGLMPALQRAAKMARETAIQTGTDLIIAEDGKLVRISPDELRAQADSPKP